MRRMSKQARRVYEVIKANPDIRLGDANGTYFRRGQFAAQVGLKATADKLKPPPGSPAWGAFWAGFESVR